MPKPTYVQVWTQLQLQTFRPRRFFEPKKPDLPTNFPNIDYASLERDILSRMPLGSKTYWSDWGKTSAVRIPLPGEPPWHTYDWFKNKPLPQKMEYMGAKKGKTYLLKIPAVYDPRCSAYSLNNKEVVVMDFDITHPDFRVFVATPECARDDYITSTGETIKQGWLGVKPEWLKPLKPQTCQCDIAVLMNSGCQCGLP